MATSAKLMTADELLLMRDDGRRYELIEGELIELTPPGAAHGFVASNASGILREFVRPRGLGAVFGAETGFVISTNLDTVRAPDAAFVSAERLPKGDLPVTYLRLAPDLVVEVVSPSDTASEVRDKIRMWLDAGCRLAWVAYPQTKSVTAYNSMDDVKTLGPSDTLDGAPVLDGLSLRVSDLFE